ncbi:MAG TPA: AarF/ABC1/UbiB kinase family protein [Solirubrobacteraceae bacterium]|nr:AarF/ABC1/UbiB kinase family protein [Solirubrobacteraceae bacterium]
MPDEPVPTSRARRTARVSGTAARIAARSTGARIATRRRTPAEQRAAVAQQQLAAARALVDLLGGLRGAAMKVGQTISTVDLMLVPGDIREEFQQILASLQQHAEPVGFPALRRVVEADLGRRLGTLFSEVDPEPLAAASIGQVHRGRLKDGRDVVLKIQYPGIAEAVHSDLRNLRLALKLLNVIAPGLDSAAVAQELRERITDELDYRLEAANQAAMAETYEGHPFIVVPAPIPEVCGERVLVSEFVDGRHFADMLERPAEERNRLGEILTRFYLNGPMRHRLLNGDPHPGNVLFLNDGRVAFLDFGFFKRLGDQDVQDLILTTRATLEGDAEALMRVVVRLGALPEDSGLADAFLEHYRALFGWLLTTEPLTIEPGGTRRIMRHYHDLRASEGLRGLRLPAEHLVLTRAFMLSVGQLEKLKPTNVWLDIAREWVLGDAPVTELGQLEHTFFCARTIPRKEPRHDPDDDRRREPVAAHVR